MATAKGTTSDDLDLNVCKPRQGKHSIPPPPNSKSVCGGVL